MSGKDKARLVVGGARIADTQLAMLRQRVDPIAMVVAKASQVEGLAVQPLFDRVGGLGPIDGIASALAWSPHPWVLVLACDMPAVHPSLLDTLLGGRSDDVDIVASTAGDRVQPLLALYHRRLLPTLDLLLETRQLRASALLSEPPGGVRVRLLSEEDVLRADPKLESFRNLNSPKDLSPQ